MRPPPGRASRPAGPVPRFGGGLQSGEGVLHALPELTGPIGRDVDDAGPCGNPLDLVGLGDPRAAVDRLEGVAPDRRLAAALLGDEGKLASWVSDQHPAPTRPLHEATWSAPVVTDERGADRGTVHLVLPLDALAFGTPLAHPWQVGHQAVETLRRRADDRLGAVLGQPPSAALAGHVAPSSIRD